MSAGQGMHCAKVILIYDAFLETPELLDTAVRVARQKRAPLDVVAYVPSWRAWLFWLGVGTTVLPDGFRIDLIGTLQEELRCLVAVVPRDLSVCSRIVLGSRRKALKRLSPSESNVLISAGGRVLPERP
jgi:hypothetical protein